MDVGHFHEKLATIFVYACAMASTMAMTIIIPVLPQMGEDLDTNIIGVVEAAFLAVLTLAVLFWGYQVDRISRRKVLAFSIIIWSSCSFLISIFAHSLAIYVTLRLIMALGLGATMPFAYSMLGDLATYRHRGFFSSGLDLIVIMGSGLGILLGGFIGPENWNLSFGIVCIFGICVYFPLLLVKFPLRGASEPEFGGTGFLSKRDESLYRLNINQLQEIFRKRTNIATFAQGTAALIPGVIFTYYLISLLSDQQNGGFGIDTGTATLLGLSFAFGRVIGYPTFGILGDFLGRKNRSRKALVATICMVAQGPLFLASFLFASLVDPAETSGQDNILFLLDQPFLILFGLLFFMASFIGGGSGPNRRSLLYDINRPEHRGSTGAIFNFTDQIGSAFGLLVGSLLLTYSSYLFVFTFVSLFYFIAALLWTPAIFFADNDSEILRNEMRARAREHSLNSTSNGK
ncbi:MAG: MFS transporter [Candidatus Heimdallarchaeota archaeon]